MSISTLGFTRYDSYEEHEVKFNQHTITTTVTHSPHVVDVWISQTEHRSDLVVGVNAEWGPNLNDNHILATLQLCVGRRCLIFQLLHASHMPSSLKNFLLNPGHTFVGVGVDRYALRLWNHYGIKVAKAVDLGNLALEKMHEMYYLNSPELSALTYEVLGVDIWKPDDVALRGWDNKELSAAQVRYACADAFACFEIGRIWSAGTSKVDGNDNENEESRIDHGN